MSKDTLATQELFAALNGRLQDSDAKHRDAAHEVTSLANLSRIVDGMKALGANPGEIAGILRFKERLSKKLMKKHKISKAELEPAKTEGEE